MEGASGIFESNRKAMFHGSELWRAEGRQCLTSDVLAVCEAAIECGVDEILLYDGHFAGEAEFNVILEQLPGNVRTFDTPSREFDWRRIRGQADSNPFGVITIGQHARYGEPWAYFPHTIQSPPINAVYVNGMHIAEIGQMALSFRGSKYIANIGCHASHKEAREISPNVTCITVKNKKEGWEPSPSETYPIIKREVAEAIRAIDQKDVIAISEPCYFSMELMEGYYFASPEAFPWKGSFTDTVATWEAPSIEMGLELFNYVRDCIKKQS
jgi:D-aminopeptidase